MLTLPSQKVKGPWVISATYVGTILNSLVFGTLVDKWGRRPMFHITNITFIVCRCKAFFPLSNSIHTFLYLKPFHPRLISFHVSSHYWAFLVLTALGTSFFPVGVRAG